MTGLRELVEAADAAHERHEALGHLALNDPKRESAFADVAEALNDVYHAITPDVLAAVEAVRALGEARAAQAPTGEAVAVAARRHYALPMDTALYDEWVRAGNANAWKCEAVDRAESAVKALADRLHAARKEGGE